MTTKTASIPPQQAPGQADHVMESFQKTMQVFLEVQKATMLAYLSGRGASQVGSSATPGRQTRVAGEQPEISNLPETAASQNATGRERDPDVTPRTKFQHDEPTRIPLRTSSQSTRIPDDHAAGNGHLDSSQGNGALSGRNGKPASSTRVAAGPSTVDVAGTSAPAVPDHASITTRLLEIVGDRTGYPIETLGLDLDMEADLGIDSIKRVEILGRLRDEFPSLKGLSDTAEVMDALARARTLGVIVDRMAELAGPAPDSEGDLRTAGGPGRATQEPQDISAVVGPVSTGPNRLGNLSSFPDGTAGPTPAPQESDAPLNGHVHLSGQTSRLVLEAVEAPLPGPRLGLMPGGRIVVTDDGRGVAEELASRLEAGGFPVDRIGGADGRSSGRPLRPSIGSSMNCGRGDRSPGSCTPCRWASRDPAIPEGPAGRSGSVTPCDGLFLLAKGTAADLEAAARSGGSCLIAATALGGRFAGDGSTDAEFFPGHGGVAGLVKTLAREWPLVRCRAVDFASGGGAAFIAERLAAEVFAGGGWAEVGYDGGRRIRLRTVESPLRSASSAIELKPGDPVVITGGARGITALVAAELARTWRPTLLIVGTTPPPGTLPSRPRRRIWMERPRSRRCCTPDCAAKVGPAAPPRSKRPTRRYGGPGRSAGTWRSCARRGRSSNMPEPTCATPGRWPPSSTAGEPATATLSA